MERHSDSIRNCVHAENLAIIPAKSKGRLLSFNNLWDGGRWQPKRHRRIPYFEQLRKACSQAKRQEHSYISIVPGKNAGRELNSDELLREIGRQSHVDS